MKKLSAISLSLLSLILLTFSPQCVSLAEEKIPITDGCEVSMHYTLTVEGEIIDSSHDREPISYTHGSSNILPALGEQLEGLKAGDKKNVTLPPDQAYGPVNPGYLMEIPLEKLPPGTEPEAGMTLQAGSDDGRQRLVSIVEVKNESIVVDMNHPLAGKTLDFDIEVISVEEL